MILYAETFCKKINCRRETLERYLCRAEFSHIRRDKDVKKGFYYKNVTGEDLTILKQMIGNKYNTFEARKRNAILWKDY